MLRNANAAFRINGHLIIEPRPLPNGRTPGLGCVLACSFRVRDIPLRDIQAAAGAIYDLVVRTPLVRLELPRGVAARSPATEIFLKLETLQPIGSFKIRGAHNAVRQLPPRRAARRRVDGQRRQRRAGRGAGGARTPASPAR